MGRRLLFYGLSWVYWLLLFTVIKALFLITYAAEGSDFMAVDWLRIIYHGWIMDLSATAYLMLIPGLLLAIADFISLSVLRKILSIYTGLVLTLVTLFFCIDLLLYGYWGTRLDLGQLYYLKTPKDALASIEWPTVLPIAAYGLGIWLVFWLLWRYTAKILIPPERFRLSMALTLLVAVALSAIPARGGLGLAPLNPGRVYFHSNHFANQAALNVLWLGGYSWSKSRQMSQPSDHFSPEETSAAYRSLFPKQQSTALVINQRRPNIVIIILESWTAKAVGPLGGDPAITPNFNRYATEGILFNRFYANGDRTDKALPAILSGYPPLPRLPIIRYPNKLAKLPSLLADLKKEGYHTAFYYGGDLNFANLKGYLLTTQAERLVTKDDFPRATYGAKWGVHDQFVLKRFAEDLLTAPQPFIYVLLTLSSHEPYDLPEPPSFPADSRAERLMNTIHYADKHIGQFLDRLKQNSLWGNTLFILLADHGVRYIDATPHYLPDKFHIPMLWLGGVLKNPGSKVDEYGSQCDLPLTLLHQLGLDSPAYPFSRDLFSQAPDFAFYTFNNGCALLGPQYLQIWDNHLQGYLVDRHDHSQLPPESARLLLQLLAVDFFHR